MQSVRSDATMSEAIRTATNYHDWIFSTFAPFLRGRSAVEVGSGHGAYSRRIATRVERLIVSDIDPLAIEQIRSELRDVHNAEYRVMDGLDPAVLGGPVDNVVLVNVLEHIDDDRALLERCRAALSPGGIVVVFAPAFAALFSRMDREAGHFRRYRKGALRRLLTGAGFEVIELRYVNAIGFFGWLANKYSRSAMNSSSTNAQIALFDRLVPIIRHVDRLLPFLGQSLIAIGRRTS